MRSLVLEDYGRMVLQDREVPMVGPDEILVRILATGICGSDIHGFAGETGRRTPGQIMGHETVGRVAGWGANVGPIVAEGDLVTINPLVGCRSCSQCAVGDEQYCADKYVIGADPTRNAAFSEWVAAPAQNVVPLPASADPELGALIEPLAVALRAVRRTGLVAGESLLVLGGGPIGQSAVLAGKLCGAERIIVSEPDARRRELVSGLGAMVLDPEGGNVPAKVESMLGSLADRTVDAVGIAATVNTALSSTRLGGVVCLCGLGAPEFPLSAYDLSVQERSIVGTFCYSPKDFRDAAGFVSEEPEGIERLISRRVSLAEGPEIFESLAKGEFYPGKVLIRVHE